jgi:3-oxoacyl-[acyl-carrier-protein] synthase III
LAKAGAETRYFRDREKGENAFNLIMDAVQSALVQGDVKPTDIDLVIYCGVGRGFLEPANAAFISRALGIHCDSFDVVDACMSWVRSLHIAYNLLMNGSYSRVLVVNGEFTVYEHGLPKVVEIRSENQLRYTFPAFTVGEAATATVLVPSQKQWCFRFRSDPSLATLCTLPLPGYKEFAGPDQRLGLNGIHQLVSFGQELSAAVVRGIIQFVQETYEDLSRFDLWFPHGATESLCHLAAARLGIGNKLYSGVFRRYGNLVSASIPAAMVMALTERRLERGHKIMLCPASAGVSYALVECEY